LLGDALCVGLATWTLVWALSFWHKTERLRAWLGIWAVMDAKGEYQEDREDGGGLGGWVNCPACCAVLALPVPLLLLAFFEPGLVALAALGVAVLAGRWWEAARPKREWWL
jgi:hypothetical protein